MFEAVMSKRKNIIPRKKENYCFCYKTFSLILLNEKRFISRLYTFITYGELRSP